MCESEPKTINKLPDEPTKYAVTCESCPGRGSPGQYRCVAEVWGETIGPSAGKPFEGSVPVTRQCKGSPGPIVVPVFFRGTYDPVPRAQTPATSPYRCSCTRISAGCTKASGEPARYVVEVNEPPTEPTHKAYALHVVVVGSDDMVIGAIIALVGWPSTLPLLVEVLADPRCSAIPDVAQCWCYWLPLV